MKEKEKVLISQNIITLLHGVHFHAPHLNVFVCVLFQKRRLWSMSRSSSCGAVVFIIHRDSRNNHQSAEHRALKRSKATEQYKISRLLKEQSSPTTLIVNKETPRDDATAVNWLKVVYYYPLNSFPWGNFVIK